MKIVFDVDCGVDDSLALLYAARNPEIEIMGVTSVFGNVDVWQSVDNVLRILDLAKAPEDIPVAAGASSPLEGEWDGPVVNIHGEKGLGNAKLPESRRKPLDIPAEELLNRIAEENPGEVTLVTLGRMTNIAGTMVKYPQFEKNIRRIVMMGGTLYHPGNVTPVAEANIAGDPRACDRVFTSGADITAVGLDVTMQTRLKKEYIEELYRRASDEDKALAEYLRAAFGYYFEGNRRQDGCLGDCPVHDPLAVIAAVKPELFEYQCLKARVECGGEYCRGMVVTDRRHRTFDAEHIRFAVQVNAEEALRELLSVF